MSPSTATEHTAAPAYSVDPALARRLVRGIVAGPRSATQTSTAPFTGLPVAELPLSTPADVQVAFEAARAAQRGWTCRPLAERARPFLALHDLVLDHRDELLDLVQIETGKSRAHAFEEVADVAIVSRHYARRASS